MSSHNAEKELNDISKTGADDDDSTVEASSSTSSMGSPMPTVEMLRKYLTEKLKIFDGKESEDVVLGDVSLDGVVNYIKKNNIKNIITMAGAGISTSAGIPDFRSPGNGLYHNLDKYNLPDRQCIFEMQYFKKNPKPFFVLAKDLYPGSFLPTISHYFIKLLHDKGLLLRHYSQNIDTLERVAGIPEDKLIEAHGTFHQGHCLKCKKCYPLEWMKEIIFKDCIPTCTECKGVVKPDIVFFGENLPDRFYQSVEMDFGKCELLIILGSSLSVQPFASLVNSVPDHCPRLLINREKAGQRLELLGLLGIGGGLNFDGKNNTRDVAWLGDCDAGCQLLADKLDWGDELKTMHTMEHEKLNNASKEKLETN